MLRGELYGSTPSPTEGAAQQAHLLAVTHVSTTSFPENGPLTQRPSEAQMAEKDFLCSFSEEYAADFRLDLRNLLPALTLQLDVIGP